MAIFIYQNNFNDRFSNEKPIIEKIEDTEYARVVVFFLKRGQVVDLHKSPSNVIISVLKGEGRFFFEDTKNFKDLKIGETVIYSPNEPHGFEAIEDLIVQAIIIPQSINKINFNL